MKNDSFWTFYKIVVGVEIAVVVAVVTSMGYVNVMSSGDVEPAIEGSHRSHAEISSKVNVDKLVTRHQQN